MDSVPTQRYSRLALLPGSAPSVSSEPSAASDPPEDGDGDPPGGEVSPPFLKPSAAAQGGLRQASGAGGGSTQRAGTDRLPQSTQDPSEEFGQGLGWIGGVAIALLTLVVPLTSVVLDRDDHPTGLLLPRLTDSG